MVESRIDAELDGGNRAIAGSHIGAVTTRLQRTLASRRDIGEIAQAVYAELAPVFDAPIWLMGIYNSTTRTVNVVWQMHAGQELPGGTFPLGNGVTSLVIR